MALVNHVYIGRVVHRRATESKGGRRTRRVGGLGRNAGQTRRNSNYYVGDGRIADQVVFRKRELDLLILAPDTRASASRKREKLKLISSEAGS